MGEVPKRSLPHLALNARSLGIPASMNVAELIESVSEAVGAHVPSMDVIWVTWERIPGRYGDDIHFEIMATENPGDDPAKLPPGRMPGMSPALSIPMHERPNGSGHVT